MPRGAHHGRACGVDIGTGEKKRHLHSMLLCRDPELATCDPRPPLSQPVAAALGVLPAEIA